MIDLHSSIRKSSVWMVIRLGVSLTVGALITTFIIRSLSVEEFGVYTLLYSMIGYVGVIGSFGIPDVFRRFLPEALQKKDYSLLKRLVLRGLVLRVLLSCATVGLVLVLHEPIGRLLKLDGFINYFAFFSFGIVIYLETSLMTSVLHSLFLHKYSVVSSTLYTLFRGSSVFVLLSFGWGIYGLLWAEVTSWAVWAALQIFLYYNKFVKHHPSTDEKTPFPVRRFFRYGGLSSLNELGSTVLSTSTDFFIITAFLGPSVVALYAFADRVIKLFVNCMPHVILADVIRPAFFTKYAESGNKQHLSDMFNLLIKIGAFFVFPLGMGIFVLGDQMIALVFKPDYLPAKQILFVLTVFTAINVFAQPTGLVLQAIEQVQINLYSKVFAILNILVALLVVEKFGVMGVVLATSFSALMKNMYCYYFARKLGGITLDMRGLITIAINAIVMATILLFLRPFVSDIYSLFIVACVGCAAFLAASWFNKAFNDQERTWINRASPRPVFAF